MIFSHSGNIGDVLYSVPTINYLTGGEKKAILYLKAAKYELGDQYEALRDLLLQQNGIKEVIPFIPENKEDWNWFRWPGLKMDYDLDLARGQSGKGRIHIIKRYFDTFGIKKDHKIVPFLKLDSFFKREERYALISLSPRWHGYLVNWKKIYEEAKEKHGKVYFTGFISEWLTFQRLFGQIEHIAAENMLKVARLIRDCEALYCNQGPALVIAQGLGKKYYLAPNRPPGSFMRTNCILGTENENIL